MLYKFHSESQHLLTCLVLIIFAFATANPLTIFDNHQVLNNARGSDHDRGAERNHNSIHKLATLTSV